MEGQPAIFSVLLGLVAKERNQTSKEQQDFSSWARDHIRQINWASALCQNVLRCRA